MDQTTTAAILYAAETGAIVRMQWGIGMILVFLLVGVFIVNGTLRRRSRRLTSEVNKLRNDLVAQHKDGILKTEASLKEQRRLRKLLENTEKALITAKDDIDRLELEAAYRKGTE